MRGVAQTETNHYQRQPTPRIIIGAAEIGYKLEAIAGNGATDGKRLGLPPKETVDEGAACPLNWKFIEFLLRKFDCILELNSSGCSAITERPFRLLLGSCTGDINTMGTGSADNTGSIYGSAGLISGAVLWMHPIFYFKRYSNSPKFALEYLACCRWRLLEDGGMDQ